MTIARTRLWAILTIIFWSLYIIYILQYPIGAWLQVGWRSYVALFTLATGIASGVLLLIHPQSGKILAISLATVMI